MARHCVCTYVSTWVGHQHTQYTPRPYITHLTLTAPSCGCGPHLDAVREEVKDQLVSFGSLWAGYINHVKLGYETPVCREDNGLERWERGGRGEGGGVGR